MALRREVLLTGAASLAVATMPRALFAALPTEKRLVVVLLRGGLDGLAAIAPMATPPMPAREDRLRCRRPARPAA